MKSLITTLLAATAAVALATGAADSPKEEKAAGEKAPESKPAETIAVMPAGPLFDTQDPALREAEPVAVPEPVWASVLAACALSLLRRGRSY